MFATLYKDNRHNNLQHSNLMIITRGFDHIVIAVLIFLAVRVGGTNTINAKINCANDTVTCPDGGSAVAADEQPGTPDDDNRPGWYFHKNVTAGIPTNPTSNAIARGNQTKINWHFYVSAQFFTGLLGLSAPSSANTHQKISDFTSIGVVVTFDKTPGATDIWLQFNFDAPSILKIQYFFDLTAIALSTTRYCLLVSPNNDTNLSTSNQCDNATVLLSTNVGSAGLGVDAYTATLHTNSAHPDFMFLVERMFFESAVENQTIILDHSCMNNPCGTHSTCELQGENRDCTCGVGYDGTARNLFDNETHAGCTPATSTAAPTTTTPIHTPIVIVISTSTSKMWAWGGFVVIVTIIILIGVVCGCCCGKTTTPHSGFNYVLF